MELYKSLDQLSWSILSTRKTKNDYIPSNSDLIEEISFIQKETAKKAIEWLVAKSAHSVQDISEHFGMSSTLVNALVDELLQAKRLWVNESEPDLFYLNDPEILDKRKKVFK